MPTVHPLSGLARAFIYFPDTSRVGSVRQWLPDGQDVILTTEDGLDLEAWLIPPTGRDREVAVLFCPGNGGSRDGRLPLFAALADRGFTVLAIDYRGYGGNPGSPTEEGLAADARAGAAYLRLAGFAPQRTVYLGESLGTGVVARLVSTDPPAGVVLRSPFTSLAEVAGHHAGWLPVGLVLPDRFPVVEHLRDSRVPVTVIHGDADEVVPSRYSARVAASVGRLHEQLCLPGVGHNDAVMFGPVVADAVVRLAEAVVPPTS